MAISEKERKINHAANPPDQLLINFFLYGVSFNIHTQIFENKITFQVN